MPIRKKRWILRECEKPELAVRLGDQLNDLPQVLARMLVDRGVSSFDDARDFFRADLGELNDPFLMRDMEAAVDRLHRAIESGEKILVYGDYDVDGTSATALLTEFLTSEEADVDYFVPNRFEHGYGLSRAGLDVCKEAGASLVVALDCGVTAVEEAEYAASVGLDLIICDHHTTHDRIPDAVAVLDPKRPDCDYPFKELCGCGVTFKLVQAVMKRLGRAPTDAERYLDLVALATAADIVPVTGENRILLREGLARLRKDPRTGIRSLATEAKIRLGECTVSSILFGLGPRINAAGRLGDAGRAVSLLISDDEVEASARARQLERLNQERRLLDQETLEGAVKMAERQLLGSDRHSIVLYEPSWHQGVIGIVASRLVDRFYRPVVMLTEAGGLVKGSARSINGINVFEAIRHCDDLLLEFGGHDFAAGLSFREENVEAFMQRFEEGVARQVNADVLDPVLLIDAEIDVSDVDRRFWAVLRQFEPYGPDNQQPVFLSRDLFVSGEPKTVGRDRTHLKFAVRGAHAGSGERSVIGFRMSDYLDVLVESRNSNRSLELVYSLEENTWNGRTTLQLRARDLRLQD